MGIRVLGPLTVEGSGELGRRDRVVLGSLATSPGDPVSADQLADALWGDHPPASAGKALQGCVVRLRKLLGREAIRTSPHGYVLHLPTDQVDSLLFEFQVARARELLTLGEADRAAYLLTDALGLWHGEAFADLENWEPGLAARRRLSELRMEAEELRLDALLRAGRYREVLSEAHALVRAAPLREVRWALLSRAQYQAGQQGEALRTIHHLKQVLAENLGIDPGPDVVALEQSILRQDSSLLVTDARAPAAACPWLGLRPYGVADADWFFGRDAEVAAALEILARTPVLALVGPSGSGKSSLLRAGVAAALKRRGQAIVPITPGAHPMESLTALGSAPQGAALVVDQFEELYSLCDDPEERAELLRALVAESAKRSVVIALRADHLADVAAHAGFSRLVERGMYLVGGLDEEGLRTAVETPARQAGLFVEPGLVDLLVGDVGRDPGALPLMSHALLETWKRREGNTLTVAGYRATGGINGAVAQSAEGLWSRVAIEQRQLLRDLVLRLVSPGPQGEPVRTRVPRRLVGTDPEHERLIEMLVAARLVTSDDGALEITHEALTRAWPRLRGWLDDDLEGQRLRHHLSGAADSWAALGRPDSELYRGVRLAKALEWRATHLTAPTELEREFLDASQRLAEAEEQSLRERARVQSRLIRRLRIVLGGAAVLLVLALVAGLLAAGQSRRAKENAEQAKDLAIASDARRVGVRAQVTDDISLSLLLAAAGARLDDSPETRANLMTALGENPLLVRSSPPAGGFLETVNVSPDGRWIAASDDQNRMHLYDAATHDLVGTYEAGAVANGEPGYLYAQFSPDSQQLAVLEEVGDGTEPVRLLDVATMQPSRRLTLPGGEPGWAGDLQFSGNGRYLAATMTERDWLVSDSSRIPAYAVVWDLDRAAAPPARVPIGTDIQGLAVSPDAQTLYTSMPLTAYDLSGKVLWQRDDVRVQGQAPDVNPGGTLLAFNPYAALGCGRVALIVDAATGDTVHELRGQRGPACEIRFSQDGRLVGSVSVDGEIVVWRTATGRIVQRWYSDDPQGLGFAPDGGLVHGGGRDSMLRTWDLSGAHTYVQRMSQVSGSSLFTHVDIAPDGRRVAYRWLDDEGRGWVRFAEAASGESTAPARLPAQWGSIPYGTWSADGARYVGWCNVRAGPSCLEPGVVTVLDATTGRVVDRGAPLGREISWAAYVDGGRSLLASNEVRTGVVSAEDLEPSATTWEAPGRVVVPLGDGSAAISSLPGDGTFEDWRMIDVATGEVKSEWRVNGLANAAAASPDGSTVVVGGDAGEVVATEVSTGDQRRSTSLGAALLWLHYSDDGELIVSGGQDGGVSLWDAETLELMGTVHPPVGEAAPSGAQFIGDTHDVAIASYDGTIYRWETDLDRAVDVACRMAGRTLTEAEWEQVLPAQPYQDVCPDQ